MREPSMFCKIKNLVTISALAFIVSATNNLHAQGLSTLSEDAMFDEGDPSLPKEDAKPKLSNDSGDDALGNLASQNVAPTTKEIKLPEAEKKVDEPVLPVINATTEDAGLFNIDEDISSDDSVFNKMSDLEKQTAILNLELRRERVKNEIEALKNQRKQAEQQEIAAEEEKVRKKQEWEKEQERKILEEQQKLRDLDIQFEKVRQEQLLNAYKNEMLKANQEWIAHEGALYKQIDDLKKEKQTLLTEMKQKFLALKNSATTVTSNSEALVNAYKKELENKDVQISVLKARNEAQERELEKRNPFAEGAEGAGSTSAEASTPASETPEIEVEETKLVNQYAVMEIRGQNGELIAKLINQDGMPFYVKKGTALQSGHTISEITSTYVKAEKDGVPDFLYFAAGGILPKEQPVSTLSPKETSGGSEGNDTSNAGPSFVASTGVPGMGKSMMAR